MEWLRNKGFEDALSKFDKRTKTWRFVILRGRFDHLVFNDQLTCVQEKVYKLGKSDHYPVLGLFELN